MIPQDKIKHLQAGALAATFGMVAMAMYVLAVALPLAAVVPAPALAAMVAGLTKEGADSMDNRIVPGMHEVSGGDALATTLPGVLISVLLAVVLAVVR